MEDSPGSHFLFWGGVLEGALGFGWGFVLFWGLGCVLVWGARFGTGQGAKGGGAVAIVAASC